MKNRSLIFIWRTIHCIASLVLFYALCLVYYYLLTGHKKGLEVFVAINVLLIEGLILLVYDFKCPITIIQKKYGDTKGFTDIFVPKKIANYITNFAQIFASIGVILLYIK